MILQPSSKELNDSIEELQTYRKRLREEIINMSQKLRISQSKIEVELNENNELNNIDKLLKHLVRQRDKQLNENDL